MEHDTQSQIDADNRFVIIPQWVIFSGISDGALRLYAVLQKYANNNTGEAFPSRATLAKDIHKKSVRSIDGYVKELKGIGALKVIVRKRPNSSENWTNLYRVITANPNRKEGEHNSAPPRAADCAENYTHLTKPTSLTPSSPAMKYPLSPSQSDAHAIHTQLRITKDEAQYLVSTALELYTAGDHTGCSDEWDTYAQEIEVLTGSFVEDAIANKRWGERLAEMIESEPGRPRYAASVWLAQMVRWVETVPYAA